MLTASDSAYRGRHGLSQREWSMRGDGGSRSRSGPTQLRRSRRLRGDQSEIKRDTVSLGLWTCFGFDHMMVLGQENACANLSVAVAKAQSAIHTPC